MPRVRLTGHGACGLWGESCAYIRGLLHAAEVKVGAVRAHHTDLAILHTTDGHEEGQPGESSVIQRSQWRSGV